MKRQKIIFLTFFLAILITACAPTSPRNVSVPRTVRDAAHFPVRIHSFSVGETDVTFIFDTDKAVLLDCSKNRDTKLIADYLSVHGFSKPDYVLLPESETKTPYPSSLAENVLVINDASRKTEINPGASTISFTRLENGAFSAVLTYADFEVSFPLTVEGPVSSTAETSNVLVQNPSPEGGHSEIYFYPLRDILRANA